MINLNILGKAVTLPETIQELTWGVYKSILTEEQKEGRGLDPVEVFGVMSGVNVKDLRGLDNADMIDLYLWFHDLYKQVGVIKEDRKLNAIVYDEKEYKLPSIEWKTTGQFQDALTLANNIHAEVDNETFCQVIERIFQIYFYPIVSGNPYSQEDFMSLNVDKARAVDVRGFGSFFLLNLIRSSSGTKKNVPLRSLLKQKALQGLMK